MAPRGVAGAEPSLAMGWNTVTTTSPSWYVCASAFAPASAVVPLCCATGRLLALEKFGAGLTAAAAGTARLPLYTCRRVACLGQASLMLGSERRSRSVAAVLVAASALRC